MNTVTLADLQTHCWNFNISKDTSDNGIFLMLEEEEVGKLSNLFVIGEVINFMGVEMRCTQNHASDFSLGYATIDIYLESVNDK